MTKHEIQTRIESLCNAIADSERRCEASPNAIFRKEQAIKQRDWHLEIRVLHTLIPKEKIMTDKPVAIVNPDPSRDMADSILCFKCAGEMGLSESTKLYESNLNPYSQCCHRCGDMVHVGPSDVILFGEKPKSIYANCDPKEMAYLGITPDGTDLAREVSEAEAEMLYEDSLGEHHRTYAKTLTIKRHCSNCNHSKIDATFTDARLRCSKGHKTYTMAQVTSGRHIDNAALTCPDYDNSELVQIETKRGFTVTNPTGPQESNYAFEKRTRVIDEPYR